MTSNNGSSVGVMLTRDHAADLKSERNNFRVSLSRSSQTGNCKPDSNTSVECNYEGNHLLELSSGNKHCVDIHSGSNYSSDIHSDSNLSADCHSSSNHSVDLHSGSNHSADFHSGSNHSVDFHSTSNHSANSSSSSNHCVDIHSSSNHSADFHSDSNHSANFHSGSNHSADMNSGSNHSAAFHSVSNHSVNFHSGSNHSADINSGSNHSADFHSGSNDSADIHSNSQHKTQSYDFADLGSESAPLLECTSAVEQSLFTSVWNDLANFNLGSNQSGRENRMFRSSNSLDFNSETIYSADFKYDDNKSVDCRSVCNSSVECKSSSSQLVDSSMDQSVEFSRSVEFMSNSKLPTMSLNDMKSSSTNSTDFKPYNNYSLDLPWNTYDITKITSNYTYSKAGNFDTSVSKPFVFDIVPLYRSNASCFGSYSDNTGMSPKRSSSYNDITPSQMPPVRFNWKCKKQLLQNRGDIQLSAFEQETYKMKHPRGLSIDTFKPRMYLSRSCGDLMQNEVVNLQMPKYPIFVRCTDPHHGILRNPKSENTSVHTPHVDNPRYFGMDLPNIEVLRDKPNVVPKQNRLDHRTADDTAWLDSEDDCTDNPADLTVSLPFSSERNPEEKLQQLKPSSNSDISDSSSIYPLSNSSNTIFSNCTDADRCISIENLQEAGMLQVKEVKSTASHISIDSYISAISDGQDSDVFCTPDISYTRKSLSFCNISVADELSDFDFIVPKNVNDVLSLSELCANSKERHIVTFSNCPVHNSVIQDTINRPSMEITVDVLDSNVDPQCSEFVNISDIKTNTLDVTGTDTCCHFGDVVDIHTAEGVTGTDTCSHILVGVDTHTSEDTTETDTCVRFEAVVNTCTAEEFTRTDTCQRFGDVVDTDTPEAVTGTDNCQRFEDDVNTHTTENVEQKDTSLMQYDLKRTNLTIGQAVVLSSSVSNNSDSIDKVQMSSQSLSDEGFISQSSFLSSDTEFTSNNQIQEVIPGFSYCFSMSESSFPLLSENNASTYESISQLRDKEERFPQTAMKDSLQPQVITSLPVSTIAHDLAKTAITLAMDELVIELMDGNQSVSLQNSNFVSFNEKIKNPQDTENPHAARRSPCIKHIINKFESQSCIGKKLICDSNKPARKDNSVRMECKNLLDVKGNNVAVHSKVTHMNRYSSELPGQVSKQNLTDLVQQCQQRGNVPADQDYCGNDIEGDSIQNNNDEESIIKRTYRLLPAANSFMSSAEEFIGKDYEPGIYRTHKERACNDESNNDQQIHHDLSVMDEEYDSEQYQENIEGTFPHPQRRIFAFHSPNTVHLHETKPRNRFSTYERLIPSVDHLGMIYVTDNDASQQRRYKPVDSFWKHPKTHKSDLYHIGKARKSRQNKINPFTKHSRDNNVHYGIYIWSPSDSSLDTMNSTSDIKVSTSPSSLLCRRGKDITSSIKLQCSMSPQDTIQEKMKATKPCKYNTFLKRKFKQKICKNDVVDNRIDSTKSRKPCQTFQSKKSTPAFTDHDLLLDEIYTTGIISTSRSRFHPKSSLYDIEQNRTSKSGDVDINKDTIEDTLSQIIDDYAWGVINGALSGITNTSLVEERNGRSHDSVSYKENNLMLNSHEDLDMGQATSKHDTNSNFSHSSENSDRKFDLIRSNSKSKNASKEELVNKIPSNIILTGLLSVKNEMPDEQNLVKTWSGMERDVRQVNNNRPSRTSLSSTRLHTVTLAQRGTKHASTGQPMKAKSELKKHVNAQTFTHSINSWSGTRSRLCLDSQDQDVHNSLISSYQNTGLSKGVSISRDSNLLFSEEMDQDSITESSMVKTSLRSDVEEFLDKIVTQKSLVQDPRAVLLKRQHHSIDTDNYVSGGTSQEHGISNDEGSSSDQLSSSVQNFKRIPFLEQRHGMETDRDLCLTGEVEGNIACISMTKKSGTPAKHMCPFRLVPETESERYRLLIEPLDYPPSGPEPQVSSLADTCIEATNKYGQEAWHLDQRKASRAQNRYACQYYSRRIQCSLCKEQ